MAWTVEFHVKFAAEYVAFSEKIQDEIAAQAELLHAMGPSLRRPHADTLKGSKHANMKELRFEADGGVWRVAYAFDPERKAILLVAGSKSGTSQSRFYKMLIHAADARFDSHLRAISKKRPNR